MFPVICTIGPFSIFSYGLMLAIAVIICSYLLAKDAKFFGISSEVIFDLIFWLILFGILGARIFYIFLNIDFFLNDPKEIIMIQHGGLAWQGGLIAGVLTGIFIVKKKKLPLPTMMDLIAPYLALGQSIGRIGCFLNGCCYGRESAMGIYFPVHDAQLYPTQLFDVVGLAIIFFILKQYQKKQPDQGLVFALYLFLAPALRFFIEFFRADHEILYFGLSIYQFICIGLMGLSVYVYTHFKGRARAR